LDLLNSYRSVIQSNYNNFTNSHTLQFTRAHIYVFSDCYDFTSRCWVVVSNGGRFLPLDSRTVPVPQLQNLSTNQLLQLQCLTLNNSPAYNISARTTQKTSLPIIFISNCYRGSMLVCSLHRSCLDKYAIVLLK
jgi:hypothetical protein